MVGLSKLIGESSIATLGGVISKIKPSTTVLGTLKDVARIAAPLVVSGVKEILKTNKSIGSSYEENCNVKRQVALMNTVMGEQVNLVPFEILNSVNTITAAINELTEELGEENVFIDELLIAYFIKKFNVPSKYVDKVYRILENNYAIENKCLRDGIKIVTPNTKKKDLETEGGKETLQQYKEASVDSIVVDKLLDKIVLDSVESENGEIKKFILGGI